MSDPETFTLDNTDGVDAPYDGWVYLTAPYQQANIYVIQAKFNNTWVGINSMTVSSATSAATGSNFATYVQKGWRIRWQQGVGQSYNPTSITAAWYKKRDYSNR